MSPRSLPVPGVAQLAKLAVLAVVLLGVFAMHGVAAHGTTHATFGGGHATFGGGMPVDEVHVGASHGAHGDRSTTPASRGPEATGGQDGQDEHDPSLMGWCLAVLGAVLIGVLGLHARGPVAPFRSAREAGCTLSPPTDRRDRDPPCLHSLSIQRC